MRTLHTPGPWHTGELITDQDGDRVRTVCGAHDEVIGLVWPMGADFENQETGPEREANARMFAAAPDLLATVRSLLELVETFAGGDDGAPDTEGPIQTSTRALLARIDGGRPLSMAKLHTETNTPAMGDRVLAAAEAALDLHGDRLSASFEHGQWWVTDDPTGAQWSVVDASGGRAVDGFDFEQITQGDDDSPTGWEEN